MLSELLHTSLFGIGLTVGVYALAQLLYARTNSILFNPVFVSMAGIILLLDFTHIPYKDYAVGGKYILFLLGPAVVALGAPLYSRRREILAKKVPILVGILAGTWLLVIGVTIVIGSAHVVMQVSGEPLLKVLQVSWIVGHLPTWLVGVTTVAALELTAAGLALAHADSLVHSVEIEVRKAETSKDAVLLERNRLADRNAALMVEVERFEKRLASDGAREPGFVSLPCRYDCGWISKALPEERARRSERAHVGHRHKREPAA